MNSRFGKLLWTNSHSPTLSKWSCLSCLVLYTWCLVFVWVSLITGKCVDVTHGRQTIHVCIICSECIPLTNVSEDQLTSGVNLLLILALLKGFYSRVSSFLTSTKTDISKLQFNQDRGRTYVKISKGWCGFLSAFCNLTFIYKLKEWRDQGSETWDLEYNALNHYTIL